MKAHHKLFDTKRFVLAKCSLFLIPMALVFLFGFTEIGKDSNPTHLTEQIDEPDQVHVQVFDFRGQGDSVAINSARENSKKNVLILLIVSTNLEQIKTVQQIATAHIRNGRKRIVIFLGDKPKGWSNDAVLFFANGSFTRVVMQQPKSLAMNQTIIDAIKEEYDKNIRL